VSRLDEKRISVGNHQICYILLGEGEPILMLHDMQSKSSKIDFEPLFKLSQNYKLVVPDLVGFGGSSMHAETPDYVQQASILSEFIEKLNLHNFSIIGYGWGGQIALELSSTLGHSVKCVILLNPTYDKKQLNYLKKLRTPTLIIFSENDMFVQLKAAYVLRDMLGNSRLELVPGLKEPISEVYASHKFLKYKADEILEKIKKFLSSPEKMVVQKPETEVELKGLAQRNELP
jgi:pimeloyl-ACP methyl ester carboxylesterase